MTESDNIIYFDNDDEFTNWCISSTPTMYVSKIANCPYYDYDFTPDYIKAIEDNKTFCINDSTSINKRKCVCRGLITKPVSNLYDV